MIKLHTNFGVIGIELDYENAPETAAILDWLALLIEDALHAKWRGEGR